MNSIEIKETLLNLCHFVHQKGYVSGSGGNISCRLGDSFSITPSGRALQSLKLEDFITVNPGGNYSGVGKPSKEWGMHRGCYTNRKDINVIIHVHSVYAVAVGCLENLDLECAMPIYTPGYGIRVGKLPVIPYLRPGSPLLAEQVAKTIQDRDSVLLANHGVVAVGSSFESALNIIEEIEENAKLHLLLNGHGRFLNESEIADLILYKK